MSVSKVLDRNQDFWPLKEGTKCQNGEKLKYDFKYLLYFTQLGIWA